MPKLIFATAGVEAVFKAQDTLREKTEAGKKSFKDYGQEVQKVGREAQAVIRRAQSEQERFNERIAKASELRKQNVITEQQLRKETALATVEYQRSTGANQRLARQREESAKKAAAEHKRYGDIVRQVESRNVTLTERYRAKIDEVNKAFKAAGGSEEARRREVTRLTREYEKQVDAQNRSAGAASKLFGEGSVQQVLGFVGGIQVVTKTFDRIRSEIALINQEIAQAAEFSKQGKGGIGELKQLVTTQAEFDKLTALSRQFVSSGASEDLDSGARTVFSLASAGLLSDEKIFRDLASQGVVSDIETLARAVKTQVASFGADETGTAKQILAKAFVASGFSPSTVPELLEAASKSAGAARAFGVSDEENLAAVAQLATAFGSASEGGTALNALIQAADQSPQFSGKGLTLAQLVRQIADADLSTPELKELLGRKEAIRAFQALALNQGEFGNIVSAIQAANEDTSGLDVRLGLRDEFTEQQREKQRVDNITKLQLEREAALGAFLDRIQEQRRQGVRAGGSRFGRFITGGLSFSTDLGQYVLGPKSILEGLSKAGQLTPGQEREFRQILGAGGKTAAELALESVAGSAIPVNEEQKKTRESVDKQTGVLERALDTIRDQLQQNNLILRGLGLYGGPS